MKGKAWLALGLWVFGAFWGCTASSVEHGVRSITPVDLESHLSFLAADEFRGRDTPSPELKIASRYLALVAERYGFKPLLADGSMLQEIPLTVRRADAAGTAMRWAGPHGDREFRYGRDFGLQGRGLSATHVSARVVFVGLGFASPDRSWDDLGGVDVRDAVVVMLDPELPEGHPLMAGENRRLLRRRSWMVLQQGAAAVLSVISEAREEAFREFGYEFEPAESVALTQEEAPTISTESRVSSLQADIRHDMATALLGISVEELQGLFASLRKGESVSPKTVTQGRLEIRVGISEHRERTANVVAWLEGRDENLRQEYVCIGSHHDHIGAGENRVYNGADDNGSGTVAMLEIAQALAMARPKRSVILVWHTGEEKGLWGARYFLEHCPVQVEKITAQINLDMISRNDPSSLYLIGTKVLSSGLDAAIQAVNQESVRFEFDYTYAEPQHPERFFFRSDHYPYLQYGIPAVWFFCGTTDDYHRETDTVDRVDFEKMARVARLAYLTTLRLGDLPGLLPLDVHPEITARGRHNMKVAWR
jgi:hypothetical protein